MFWWTLLWGALALLYGGVSLVFFVGLTISVANLPMSYEPSRHWPGWVFSLLIFGGSLLWPLTLLALSGSLAFEWVRDRLTPPTNP